MKERFIKYLYDSYSDLPVWVYEGLLVVLFVGAVVAFVTLGARKGGRVTMRLLLAEYVVMIFCSTVFIRSVMDERKYDFRPFWSYRAIQDGKEELFVENIMNVAVFVPVGVMLGCSYKGMTWWKTLLVGLCTSVSIEALQFVFHRGFSEVDDVMHNTLGCVFGYGVYLIANSLFRSGYGMDLQKNQINE